MKAHFLFVGLLALALARPEIYKENEEFNYARSSTDEGSKSGFYEAQRGNTGGNYERAHNMDHVAQGQMSDIVDQVGGQVDEVADSKHGNLYGSAYARGVYGQRHYDTSNLSGRNFQENTHRGYASGSNAASGSSVTSSSAASGASRYQQYNGGRGARLSDDRQTNAGSSLQQTDSAQGWGSAHSSRQQSAASGHQQYSALSQHSSSNSDLYDQNYINSDQTNQYRIVPVRVVVRPLTPVQIPVQAVAREQIVDSTHRHTNEQESRVHSQNSLTQNAENVYSGGLNTGNLNGKDKHYESSYNYHKEWEKHSDVTPLPLGIPTSNPLSEPLNVYNQQHNQYRREHLSHSQSNTASHSASVSTNHEQAALNEQASLNEQAGVNERGYQSGHQYQRVAVPINNRYVVLSPTPEFVATGTKQGTYSGSNLQQSSGYRVGSRSESQTAHGDESLTQGHLRTNSDNLLIASGRNRDALTAITGASGNSGSTYGTEPKKYESSYSYHKSWERQGDPYIIQPASSGLASGQSQNLQTSSDHGYGSDAARYSSHGSHSHSAQEDCDENQRYKRSASDGVRGQQNYFGQQTEDLGQQTQNLNQQTEDFEQKTQDLTQQTEDLGQQTEDIGQQTQDLTQQSEDLGQQTEDLGQQTEDLGQQTQDFTQNNESLGQQMEGVAQDLHHRRQESPHQIGWQYGEPSGQNIQRPHYFRSPSSQLENLGDKVQQNQQEQAGINSDNLGQVLNGWDQSQVGQESENIWNSNNQHTVQTGHRDLAPHNMDHIDANHRSSSFSETGRHSEQRGHNNWEENDQNSQHSHSHSENQSGSEWRNSRQHSEHYGYQSVQGVHSHWEQGREYNVNHRREQESNGQNYEHQRGYTIPATWKQFERDFENNREVDLNNNNQHQSHRGYGYHYSHNYPDITTPNIESTTKKENDDQKVSNNENVEHNEEVNAGTILRGDLGTDKPVDATSSTTPKSLTVEEYEQYLKDILSMVSKNDTNINGESQINPMYTSISNKEKTPEEIESLSLTRDSEPYSTNKENLKPSSIHHEENTNINHKPGDIGKQLVTSDKQSVYVNRNTQGTDAIIRELTNERPRYSPTNNQFPREISQSHKPDNQYLREQAEELGQQVENFNQMPDEVGHDYINLDQQSTNFGQEQETFDKWQAAGQETYNLDQQSQDFGQQVESLDQNVEGAAQQREYVEEQVVSLDELHQEPKNSYDSSDWRPQDTIVNNKPIGRQLDTNGKQSIDVNKHTQDMDTIIRHLTNAAARLSNFTNIHLAQNPVYYQSGNHRVHQAEDQEIGPEQKIFNKPQEAGQVTYNLNQQVQSLDQNVGVPQKLTELRQQSDNLGQHSENQGQQSKDLGQPDQKQKSLKLDESPEIRKLNAQGSDQKVIGLKENKPESTISPTTATPTPNPNKKNPGFWQNVGTKLDNAKNKVKDKVSCWFGRCKNY